MRESQDHYETKVRRWGYDSLAHYQDVNRHLWTELTEVVYRRPGIFTDGHIGPVTAHAIDQRRCDTPDFRNGRAIEESNIPNTCRFDYGLYLDESTYRPLIGLTMSQVKSAFQWACDEWNRSIGIRFYLEPGLIPAKCYIDFQSLSGTTLAYSHLADNSCSDDKKQRYDYRSWDMNTMRLTVLHELGHLLGLGHQNGQYIMNPQILTHLDGLTASDKSRARGLGYGEPVTPTPAPDPPPTGITDAEYVNLRAQQIAIGQLVVKAEKQKGMR